MTAYARMLAAIERANAEAIAEFTAETGLIARVRPRRAEFHHDGNIWLAETVNGTARIRTMFIDPAGVEYVDAYLAGESIYHRDRDAWNVILDDLMIGHGDELHEVTVTTLTRGAHAAIITPVPLIAGAFHIDSLTPFPGDNWARGWSSWPFITDANGPELVSLGVPVA